VYGPNDDNRHGNSKQNKQHWLIVALINKNAKMLFLHCNKCMIFLEGAQAAQTLFRNNTKAQALTVNSALFVGYHHSKNIPSFSQKL
jgi:hypothetical protein